MRGRKKLWEGRKREREIDGSSCVAGIGGREKGREGWREGDEEMRRNRETG